MQKSLSSGVSTNPLAQLAAACTSLCNEMKPKTTSPTYNRASLGAGAHPQFSYPPLSGAPQPVTNSIKTGGNSHALLNPCNFISAMPSLQTGQQQVTTTGQIDYSHLLTAQELLAKQAAAAASISSLPCTQNLASSLDTSLALAAASKAGGNLEYLTKLYLQAAAAKKSSPEFTGASTLDLLSSEKLLSQLSPVATPASLQSAAGSGASSGCSTGHLHNGLDYRICPCVSCQTLRLTGVLTAAAAQQQLNNVATSKAAGNVATTTIAASNNNVTTTIQQHFLLPHKNPLTGALQYLPVCPDPSNCCLCVQLSQNNSSLSSLSAVGQALKSNCGGGAAAALTTEQYLSALASQSANLSKPGAVVSTSPSPTSEKRQLNDFLAPLQINTSPSPGIEKAADITCSWTENGLPCGQKFLSEDQLFDHIKKAHTSNMSSHKQNSPPPSAQPSSHHQFISLEEELHKLNNGGSNPLTSLSNLSKKVLPTSTVASRFHPYPRPSAAAVHSASHSSDLLSAASLTSSAHSSTNHITSINSSRPSALPLLSSSFVGGAGAASQHHNHALSTLSALSTFPGGAGGSSANLPFSLSASQSASSSQLLSNSQMSSLLFAAAAR